MAPRCDLHVRRTVRGCAIASIVLAITALLVWPARDCAAQAYSTWRGGPVLLAQRGDILTDGPATASDPNVAADFTLEEWFTRVPMSLYGDFENKIVVLEFGAYWCPYAKRAASELVPNIQNYCAARGGNPSGIPVELIFMNLDASNPASTDAFLTQYGFDLALDDTQALVYGQYGSGGIPVIVVINGAAGTYNSQWEVLYQQTGYPAGEYLTIRSIIDQVQPKVDTDGDGVFDLLDNCLEVQNPDQEDLDLDGVGDFCDDCPAAFNPDQSDLDADLVGDVCDDDVDGDGVPNEQDTCLRVVDPGQEDEDADGLGDVCDACLGTTSGVHVDEVGCPVPLLGDIDSDGDIDMTDFSVIQLCLSGLAAPQSDPACALAKLDSDSDVDAADIAIFQNCLSGADVPGSLDCAR